MASPKSKTRTVRPLVTVITPCLNAFTSLKENIACVCEAREILSSQGWDLEHIIVDGGSTDHTLSWLSQFACHHPYWRLILGITGGPYAAMNAGLQQASGFYSHILNADDLLIDPLSYANFLIKARTTNTLILLSSIGYFKRPATHLNSLWPVDPIPDSREEWRRQLCSGLHYPHPGFIATTRTYSRNLFDTSFNLSADYKLMQDILIRSSLSAPVMVSSVPLVAMAEGGLSSSWMARLRGWRQLSAINRELGIQAPPMRRYWKKLWQKSRRPAMSIRINIPPGF